MHVEPGPKAQVGRDLRHGEAVLEAQLQEQPIARMQSRQRRFQCLIKIALTELRFGIPSTRIGKRAKIHLGPDQIHQPPARGAIFAGAGGVLAPTPEPAVSAALMIETEPLGYNHQPGRKLAPPVGGVAPQPPVVVRLELLQDEGIAVHHSVVVTPTRAGDVQQQPTVKRDELGPAFGPGRRISREQQPTQSGGRRSRHG